MSVESRQTLIHLPSGTIDLVLRENMFVVLQFNVACVDALPYCRANCCRLRAGFSVVLQPDEVGHFRSVPVPHFPEQQMLEAKPDSLTCVYLADESSFCTLHEKGGPEAKPFVCRNWHCSPGGKNSDGSEPLVKDGGWFLSPMHGDLQTAKGIGFERA